MRVSPTSRLKRCNLRLDHAVDVQLGAASEGKLFCWFFWRRSGQAPNTLADIYRTLRIEDWLHVGTTSHGAPDKTDNDDKVVACLTSRGLLRIK